MSMFSNWSELHEELLSIIVDKIKFYEDFLRFGAVCHPWRTVTLSRGNHNFSKSIPWLMLTADEDEDERRFYIPSEDRVCCLNLPEARGCHCWGSPYGWLVTLGFDQQFHLLNPLTRKRLPLPPLSTFPNLSFTASAPGRNRSYSVHKAIVTVSSNDGADYGNGINPQSFVVYLVIGQFKLLVFAKPGDTTWVVVEDSPLQEEVINFNGKIYTARNGGQIMVCDDPRGWQPTLIRFAALPDDVTGTERFYLVELGGELHLVVRTLEPTQTLRPPTEFHHHHETYFFEVFKLDLSTRKWDAQLETLGDYTIFIGSNTTFALKASDYPNQCKPGCIYFTDDFDEAFDKLVGEDMGIYNHEAETLELVYEGDDILSRFCPPVWIIPNPF